MFGTGIPCATGVCWVTKYDVTNSFKVGGRRMDGEVPNSILDLTFLK